MIRFEPSGQNRKVSRMNQHLPLREQERRLVDKLTGPSRGLNRPALCKELASIRRQIAASNRTQSEPAQ